MGLLFLSSQEQTTACLCVGLEARSDVFVCPKDKAKTASGGLREISVRKFTCRRVRPRELTKNTAKHGGIFVYQGRGFEPINHINYKPR
jgi:hypothetical protein